jgi:cytochrome c biogenesis protein CcdA
LTAIAELQAGDFAPQIGASGIMILVLLVYLGGVLTILSPCILPVLPFVFARSEQKFLSSGLPLLIGMAVTLIRQGAAVGEHVFSIEFLDSDIQAYSFTFG